MRDQKVKNREKNRITKRITLNKQREEKKG